MLRLDWSRVLQVRSVSNCERVDLGFPHSLFSECGASRDIDLQCLTRMAKLMHAREHDRRSGRIVSRRGMNIPRAKPEDNHLSLVREKNNSSLRRCRRIREHVTAKLMSDKLSSS